jgi:hypothetical protein
VPTAPAGPWLDVALAKGLIRPSAARSVEVRAPTPPPPGCSEKRFQRAVVALAERAGWECYHTFNSKRSQAGWPDLALVRGAVLILAELKTARGALSAPQRKWLAPLRAVPGVRVRLWRPTLWPAIAGELTAEGGGA